MFVIKLEEKNFRENEVFNDGGSVILLIGLKVVCFFIESYEYVRNF